MKFISFKSNIDGRLLLGVINNDNLIIDINLLSLSKNFIDMNDLISNINDGDINILKKVAKSNERIGATSYLYNEISLLPPIQRTVHDIICVGLNYDEHIEETKRVFDQDLKTPESAVFFSKRANILKGHEDSIRIHSSLDECFDYENELAIVIGKEGIDISEDDALDHVFGYTILNDLSARTLQRKHEQWFKGKSLDGYTSMGPVILHSSGLEHPIELDIITRVNDEVRQKSNTKYMIRDISKLISEISQGMTLIPGDIIATGTPVGVGMGFDPPKYMNPGDIVECEIENIGKLRNQII